MHPLVERDFPLESLSIHGVMGPPTGMPLVFLHGVTRRWQDYTTFLPPFVEHYQIFALDHRGHGRSDRSATCAYLVRDYATDFVSFLERHLSNPAIVYGHSLGALVAVVAAARVPHRVRALILEDPPATALGEGIAESRFLLQFTGTRQLLDKPSQTVEQLTAGLVELPVRRPSDGAVVRFGDLRDIETLRFAAGCLLQLDPKTLDPLLAGRWLEGVDWFGALPQIKCPTLLLQGDPSCGGMLESGEADRLLAGLANGSRVFLAGVGHSIHYAEPKRTARIVQEFLECHSFRVQN
jgi:pimeloyl-ACP methyl ester carboxylesterase